MAVTAFKATNEAPTTFKLVVPKEHARMRLDLFLVKSFPEFSRSRVQQLIRAGFVRVGGATARPHQPVRSGDEIEVTEPPPEKIQTDPEAIPLTILYEDDDLIVINKATGMTVHPGDLIHADKHGVLVVPSEIARQVPDAAAKVARREQRIIAHCQAADFSLEELKRLVESE